MVRKHLSYANVIASTALFVALGGTAVAALTLPRDSVGARQIRTDAVRSPEIIKDAVRSSEIRDEGINVADISTGAATALRGDVHVEERPLEFVDRCSGNDLTVCPNHAEMQLASGAVPDPGRNWLVQAKLQIGSAKGESRATNRCGLVAIPGSGPDTLLDEVQFEAEDVETIALSAVVKKRQQNPTIALRCTEQDGFSGAPSSDDVVNTSFLKLTALEVGAVTGP
jgi:hypothetical protein